MSDEPTEFDECIFVGGLPYRIVLVREEEDEEEDSEAFPSVHISQDGRPVAFTASKDVNWMLGWALRASVTDSQRGRN